MFPQSEIRILGLKGTCWVVSIVNREKQIKLCLNLKNKKKKERRKTEYIIEF